MRLIIDYDILDPAKLIPDLLHSRDVTLNAIKYSKSDELTRLLNEKISEIEHSVILASGVKIDAFVDRETLIPGSHAEIAIRVFIPKENPIEIVSSAITSPDNWSILPIENKRLSNEISLRKIDTADKNFTYQVHVPIDAEITQPYWLIKNIGEKIYDWSDSGASRTKSFDEPILKSRVELMIHDKTIFFESEIKYRERDRIRGELRRRVDVVPKVSIEPSTKLLIVPISKKYESIDIRLAIRNNSNKKTKGIVKLAVPKNWDIIPSEVNFTLDTNKKIDSFIFSLSLIHI